MKRNYLHKLILLLMLTLAFSQCKKDSSSTPNTGDATREQLTLDSIFLYARQIYFWNDVLPTYDAFKPRSYTSYGLGLTAFEKELFNITQYKINTATGKAYEYSASDPTNPKYSYIDDNSSSGSTAFVPASQSYVELDGKGDDFGIGLSSVTATDIRIRYVNLSSPGAVAGLQRGDRIVSINGRTTRADSQTEVNYINDAFDASSVTLKVEKSTGTTVTVSLNQTSYTTSPVLKKLVIEKGGKKIGYLVFARFSEATNAEADLDSAFSQFAKAGVSDLVIDLRYNGGGYVTTAEHLINLIAPSSLKGKVMYTEYYNDMMQKGNASILKNQPYYDENNHLVPYTSGANGKYVTYADMDYSVSGNTYRFEKEGSLEGIKSVCFIVSGSTASASELTINALKPYLNVKLIGSATYGKPVGFFGIDIDDYTIYMSNFQTKNASGEGDYFNGMTVEYPATDDVTRDFGNESETCLAKALAYITTGSIASVNSVLTLKGGAVVSASNVNPEVIPTQSSFTGMIENRYKLK